MALKFSLKLTFLKCIFECMINTVLQASNSVYAKEKCLNSINFTRQIYQWPRDPVVLELPFREGSGYFRFFSIYIYIYIFFFFRFNIYRQSVPHNEHSCCLGLLSFAHFSISWPCTVPITCLVIHFWGINDARPGFAGGKSIFISKSSISRTFRVSLSRLDNECNFLSTNITNDLLSPAPLTWHTVIFRELL